MPSRGLARLADILDGRNLSFFYTFTGLDTIEHRMTVAAHDCFVPE